MWRYLKGLRDAWKRRDAAPAHGLAPGSRHYRAFVGPPERYDLVSAIQFNLLTALGLREESFLLDIGCGSLRGGRLFIPYLLPGRYFGIEPERWLIDEGIRHELGEDAIRIKRPVFSSDRSFTLTTFGVRFDYMLAQSIFSHASVPQIRRCLSQAREALLPGGYFAATYVPGESDHEGEEWVYPACVRYTPATMAALAAEAGLAFVPIEWPHPKQKWAVIVHAGKEGGLENMKYGIWNRE